ncbi:hypothetical protein K440DRAFT_613899 [Wilcoxina mikolae CBS 423.85]|nr:hypothetical protein K440DRAFT_613899 [Wilcoxina mikolae CBS 423.85]
MVDFAHPTLLDMWQPTAVLSGGVCVCVARRGDQNTWGVLLHISLGGGYTASYTSRPTPTSPSCSLPFFFPFFFARRSLNSHSLRSCFYSFSSATPPPPPPPPPFLLESTVFQLVLTACILLLVSLLVLDPTALAIPHVPIPALPSRSILHDDLQLSLW